MPVPGQGYNGFHSYSSSPTYSKVKGRMLVCDANILCQKYTIYHWFCEGFRKLNNNYEKKIDVGQFTQIVKC
jgi:hypothetical protein